MFYYFKFKYLYCRILMEMVFSRDNLIDVVIIGNSILLKKIVIWKVYIDIIMFYNFFRFFIRLVEFKCEDSNMLLELYMRVICISENWGEKIIWKGSFLGILLCELYEKIRWWFY